MKLPISFPRTLVAEDDASDAVLLQRAFRDAGVSAAVDFVSDGLQAIEYLSGKELSANRASGTLPSLLLLDLRMPGLSGFEVLEWLRQHPHLRPARVVAFSGSPSPEELVKAIALGADEYLAKPKGGAMMDSVVQSLGRVVRSTEEADARLATTLRVEAAA